MIAINLTELCAILEVPAPTQADMIVTHIATDSRRVRPGSLFVALKGGRTDGHAYLREAFTMGARAALVCPGTEMPADGNQAVLIKVPDPLAALQGLAAWYRRTHLRSVIAITGSNGKTVVKDALAALLADRYATAASPGSFNSQLGVALSILLAQAQSDFSVLEAGISQPGDMLRLEQMLAPDYGILTCVGMAHIAAFGRRERTAHEKMTLFRHLGPESWVILPGRDPLVAHLASGLRCATYFTGETPLLPQMTAGITSQEGTLLHFLFPNGEACQIQVATRSPQLWTDLHQAICAASLLGIEPQRIQAVLEGYRFGPTRMEIWRSPEGITLVNDACSSDPLSVQAAMHTATSVAGRSGRKLFVFGGMRELGQRSSVEHAHIGDLAGEMRFDTLITVGEGEALTQTSKAFTKRHPGGKVVHCDLVGQLQTKLRPLLQPEDTVLFKGPRHAGIAAAAQTLCDAMAPSRLIVDLGAIQENVRAFRKHCGPRVKLLAMIKAIAYGSDLGRLPNWLQQLGVDWFGVSTTDEGAALRRASVRTPILVTLPTPEEVDKIIRYRLTPAAYSLDLAQCLVAAAERAQRRLDVHLKIDTGMGRLGIHPQQLEALLAVLGQSGHIHITGVMTHFSCADDAGADEFSMNQLARFRAVCTQLEGRLQHPLIRHAAASGAAMRFPQAHEDMVRVGLALYGIHPSHDCADALNLQPALSLVSRIVHIGIHPKGHHVGYGATFTVPKDGTRIGIVPIGYHDGVPWALSNRGSVLVEGVRAPIAGRVSMDSIAVDLTEVPTARIGHDVLLFGKSNGAQLAVEEVARLAGTIPYELISRISPRIQRIYIGE